MNDQRPYPRIPAGYDEWMALYFRNRLTSAYADLAGGEPPEDMAQLLERADSLIAANLSERPDAA